MDLGNLLNNKVVIEDNNEKFVSIPRICDALGIKNSYRQREKLQKDKNFTLVLKNVIAKDGKYYETWCLSLDQLEKWVNTISPNKVNKNKSGYVYVLSVGNIIKIGASKNCRRRFKELISSFIYLNSIDTSSWISEKLDDCYEIEKTLHNYYKKYNCKGNMKEYFKGLTVEKIKEKIYKLIIKAGD